jgi:uncharacterized protein (UPF0333 family)
MKSTYKGLSRRRGQAMIEYMIIAAMLIAAVSILAVFLYTFKEQSGRVLDLAASEYP